MKLFDQPRWHEAAQLLVDGFAQFDAPEDRIRLMDKLCQGLGGSLYPAFLQILYNVERHGDAAAHASVTETLIHALMTGRLPAGKMAAWGSTTCITDTAFGQTRSMGPVEYLCAWYAQPSGLPPLTRGAFADVGESLVRLVSTSDTARSLYRAKLLGDVEDPLGGTMSSQTRKALKALAESWTSDNEASHVVEAFLNSLQAGGGSLGELRGNPFV